MTKVSVSPEDFVRHYVQSRLDTLNDLELSIDNDYTTLDAAIDELDKAIVTEAEERFKQKYKQYIDFVNIIDSSSFSPRIESEFVASYDVIECRLEASKFDSDINGEISVDINISSSYDENDIKQIGELEHMINKRDELFDKKQKVTELKKKLNNNIKLACDRIVNHLVSKCDEKELEKIIDDTLA